jgi:hypothetical protein
MDDDPQPADLPVTDRICVARMGTLEAQYKGLKTAIYAVGATIVIIITVVQVALAVVFHV